MAVGSVKQIKDWSAYYLLVELYCDGLPFVIDEKRGTIERVDDVFNECRLNYTNKLNELLNRKSN